MAKRPRFRQSRSRSVAFGLRCANANNQLTLNLQPPNLKPSTSQP
ncbi:MULTISPECIES: hypothetical protein [unclassified Moorena]|nr:MULTISPECIES: hypothetical protein [unclassified Moorena]